MPTYRIQVSKSSLRVSGVLYGLEILHKGTKFICDSNNEEIVFEAGDEVQANSVFDSLVPKFPHAGDKWTVSLQLVKMTGGLVHRLRTLRTFISPR